MADQIYLIPGGGLYKDTEQGKVFLIPGIGLVKERSGGSSAALTGTAVDGVTESEIVTGGETIIITLTGDTWVATVGDDNGITDALILGIDSAQSEAEGWDAVVKANMVHGDITRDTDTQLTIVLAAEAIYEITADETITITIPATSLTAAGEIVCDSFVVTNESDGGIVIFRCRIEGL